VGDLSSLLTDGSSGDLLDHAEWWFVNSGGDEAMRSTSSYLDLTALGRQKQWEDSPEGYPQTPPYQWWAWHDEAR
jgi:predicted dithiol-disulfide oxidoreductase (DUF899 family)